MKRVRVISRCVLAKRLEQKWMLSDYNIFIISLLSKMDNMALTETKFEKALK
jgi:hypothetical protein